MQFLEALDHPRHAEGSFNMVVNPLGVGVSALRILQEREHSVCQRLRVTGRQQLAGERAEDLGDAASFRGQQGDPGPDGLAGRSDYQLVAESLDIPDPPG